jgi:hypothetical protein
LTAMTLWLPRTRLESEKLSFADAIAEPGAFLDHVSYFWTYQDSKLRDPDRCLLQITWNVRCVPAGTVTDSTPSMRQSRSISSVSRALGASRV